MKTKVLILGMGNVGTHLANALNQAGVESDLQSSRDSLPELYRYSHIIIATKDDAIASVAARLNEAFESQNLKGAQIIMHTSGSIPLSVLTDTLPAATPCGVFYPMQTFSKGVDMRYDDIPFLLEATDLPTLESIKALAAKISPNIIEADSKVRADYHIGAVLTCNFANHLCELADDYLTGQNLDFKYLLPLLRQTVAKLSTTSPAKAQTGPAVRHDQKVIDYHLSRIASATQRSSDSQTSSYSSSRIASDTHPSSDSQTSSSRLSQIYTLLTDSIRKSHP